MLDKYNARVYNTRTVNYFAITQTLISFITIFFIWYRSFVWKKVLYQADGICKILNKQVIRIISEKQHDIKDVNL